jgi:amidase
MNPFATLTEMRAELAAGKLTAADLIDQHIARIEKLDGPLNSVVVRDFERARATAREADSRLKNGNARALEGVPVTIKEAINVAGLPTTVGEPKNRGFVSKFDAPSARRLREAGAIVLGKSNVPLEMADWQANNPVYGRTNNPWNLDRTCGGSSGGGAVVAAGFAALDIGSDIGGSVRVPAAFCGVYGLRPSETLIPKSGQYAAVPMPNAGTLMGVQGPIARSAADIEAAIAVMAGPDTGEDVAWRVTLPPPRREALPGARIAVLDAPAWAPVDAEQLQARDRAIAAFAKAGAHVARAQPEAMGDWREHMKLYMRLLSYMLSARWSDDDRKQRARALRAADDEFAVAQAEGMEASAAQLFMWHVERERVRAAWREFFGEWDAMVTPTFHNPAHMHIAFQGPALSVASINTITTVNGEQLPYNRGVFYPHVSTLAGQPALACPAGLSRDGLPLSVQIIGPYLEDLTVTRLGTLLAREIGGFTAPAAFAV